MSINWEKSAGLNHCTIGELKNYLEKYSESHKRIIAICEGIDCDNREREIAFRAYHDLCISCSLKRRYEDPKEHEKTGLATKRAHIDDPTLTQQLKAG